MKTFKFWLVLRPRENTDVFITLDEISYGIHSQKSSYPPYAFDIASTLMRRCIKVMCPLEILTSMQRHVNVTLFKRHVPAGKVCWIKHSTIPMLTFTIWANSADDKLIFFWFFFP